MMPKKSHLIAILILYTLVVSNKGKLINNDEDQMVNRSMFPDDFIFGVATSAYQIEGAYLEDGKGLSNWDVFAHIPGNTDNENNGDVADDHYHRYMEDIDNLEFLGVNGYRLSISWSRILPKGRFGEVNPSGIMFYNKILDTLLLKGIEPFVTIHHNDIPQELEDRFGSWLSPQMQEDFIHFAKTCFENFGDRVKKWATINEPNIEAEFTYMRGIFPPNRCSMPFGNCTAGNSDIEPLIVVHNMLISHAKAVKLYREQFQPKQGGSIGLVMNAFHFEPYAEDEFSYKAVNRSYDFYVAWILNPLVYGDYPSIMRKNLGNDLPNFTKDEEVLVKGSLDFIGINHYTTFYAIDCFHYPTNCIPSENRPIRGFISKSAYNQNGVAIGSEMGVYGFHVVPSGLEKLLNYISKTYGNLSVYITENGYCPPNYQQGSKMLDDFERIEYHKAYLASLINAMRKGAKVKGYFAWTLMDNYEWANGYDISFGLYYVDRKTLNRTPRLSAKWYANFNAKGSGASIVSSF